MDESQALAEACRLVEMALPSVAPLSVALDVFESPAAFGIGKVVERAEAFDTFEKTGRLEVDRRVLDRTRVHDLVGSWCHSEGPAAGCRCRESLLACAILDSYAASGKG